MITAEAQVNLSMQEVTILRIALADSRLQSPALETKLEAVHRQLFKQLRGRGPE